MSRIVEDKVENPENVCEPVDPSRPGELIRSRFRCSGASQEVLDVIVAVAVDFLGEESAAHPGLFLAPLAQEHAPASSLDRDPICLGGVDEFLDASNLPAMPRTGLELKRLLDNPNSTASDLAEVVLKDHKLTASVLKLVNSPMFMLPSKVDTVTRAITVVGLKHVSHLALAAILMTIFEASPKTALHLNRFWLHSLAVGLICRNLAALLGRKVPERAFVAGLLHDIGQLVVLHKLPEAVPGIFALASAEGLDHYQAERRILGFSHTELGEALLTRWHFPAGLVSSTAFHHDPSGNPEHGMTRMVHVADILAQAVGLATCRDYNVRALDPTAFTALGLDKDRLRQTLSGLGEQLSTVYSILAP